jgi:hypothetical protein
LNHEEHEELTTKDTKSTKNGKITKKINGAGYREVRIPRELRATTKPADHADQAESVMFAMTGAVPF